jgi:hypothetical protein
MTMTPQAERYYNLPQEEKDKILAPARHWFYSKVVWYLVVPVAIIVGYVEIYNAGGFH